MEWTSDRPIRVLVAGGDDAFRGGVLALLKGEPDIVVAGNTRTVADAIEAAGSLRPDVVLLDDGFGSAGVDAIREILAARPQSHVIMLASVPDDPRLLDWIGAGASGFLLKDVPGEELIFSVRKAAEGSPRVAPAVARSILDLLSGKKRAGPPEPLETLSWQEERVLSLLDSGRTSRSIGLELNLAEGTVRNYISRIFSKLGVRTRAESVAYLARRVTAEPYG